jgi:hypothetical protein
MWVMVALTVDEVVAMGRFLRQSSRAGKPLWRTLWLGGIIEDGAEDTRSPSIDAPPWQTAPAMVWGVGVPLLSGRMQSAGPASLRRKNPGILSGFTVVTGCRHLSPIFVTVSLRIGSLWRLQTSHHSCN